MDLNQLKTDQDKKNEGVWVEIDSSTELLIASNDSADYKRMLKKELRPYQKALQLGTLQDDIYEKVVVKCMANHILLDWKGLTDDGKPLKYSVDNAIKLLGDPQLKHFRDFISEQAMDQSLFKIDFKEQVKAEAKK